MSPTDPSRFIARALAERTTQVEHTGPAIDHSLHGLAVVMDAARWRQIATLMRKIDEEKRGVSPAGMDDDELLDLALTALRTFPKLVAERDGIKREMEQLKRDVRTLFNKSAVAIPKRKPPEEIDWTDPDRPMVRRTVIIRSGFTPLRLEHVIRVPLLVEATDPDDQDMPSAPHAGNSEGDGD